MNDQFPSFHEQLQNLTLNIDDYEMNTGSATPSSARRPLPNERWKSNKPTASGNAWKVSSKAPGMPQPDGWKMTSSVSDITNRQSVPMPVATPSISSQEAEGGWKMTGRPSYRPSSASPTTESQSGVYYPPTPILGMPEANPTPRMPHDNRLNFDELQSRRQSAPQPWTDSSIATHPEDQAWHEYHQYVAHNYAHQDPYTYTPQISSMPSPATFMSPNVSHMITPSATPKPLPEEPPMPPPRKSIPGGFLMAETGFSTTPSPMLHSHDPIPFEYHNLHPGHYRHSISTPDFPAYGTEPSPPLSHPPSTSPAVSSTPSSVEHAPAGKKEKGKKEKDRGKGKPERKVRQITVPSINKEHRVWINVDPTETGLTLAEKIHIIATFRTRKILSITTASGRQIPLDHRPIFGSWVDMEKFVDGEPWKVEWGELDKGVMDKLFSKMVSGNRKPPKRDERLDRI
ncbi:hypothetical protein K450DRAFT_235432 [Umbelopsis ramanniana AG]|uniref:Uncharacterized protein n=1 Tax=Umbelopsis ramanniana AG TaxID=1314678 RepID=A0AAD5EBP3_UMBRA|nr:uncharacterized protein K450DRAFT_235432 [Umbelopsis ramanniana AG]KAI8580956.1 hypothetical protein K450DRAFT_235432 [Umbelopsis ramanniana AG]